MSSYDSEYDRLVREVFEGPWRVQTNIQNLRSDAELMQDTNSSYGAPDYVVEASKELIETTLTIDEMVELWKKRRSFTICNNADVKSIYDIINRYINVFIERTKHSVNSNNAPIDDMLSLDELAHYIYPAASRSMLCKASVMERLGIKGIISKQEILGKTTEAENKTAPGRYRLADSILSMYKG
jgi:hypothetical protein